MIPEKSITINGTNVSLCYCAATEMGYEKMSGKSSAVFVPRRIEDGEGGFRYIEPEAQTEDYVMLALSAAVAQASRKGEKNNLTMEMVMYEAKPDEVKLLMTTVLELRNEWYDISPVVKPEIANEQTEESKKN